MYKYTKCTEVINLCIKTKSEEIFNKRITLSTVFLNDVFKVNFSTTKEDFLFYHYSFDKVFSKRIFLKVLFFFFYYTFFFSYGVFLADLK